MPLSSPKKLNKKFGNFAENYASELLARNGFSLITRNYSTGLGEIDIIASKIDTLYFVEVKARHTTTFGLPEEAVNFRKRKKIEWTAWNYIQRNKLPFKKFRVLVISLLINENTVIREKMILMG